MKCLEYLKIPFFFLLTYFFYSDEYNTKLPTSYLIRLQSIRTENNVEKRFVNGSSSNKDILIVDTKTGSRNTLPILSRGYYSKSGEYGNDLLFFNNDNVSKEDYYRNSSDRLLRNAFDLIQSKDICDDDVILYVNTVLIQDIQHPFSEKLYTRLLESCISRKFTEYSFKLFYRIIELNIPFSNNIFNNLLFLVAESGYFDEGLKIIDNSLTVGFTPTLHSFSSLLKICSTPLKARKLFNRMESAGLDINAITFTNIIKSCEISGGDYRSVLELLDWMKIVGVMPNQITYCCVISILAKAKAGDVAINVLREMLDSGIAPNELCFGSTLIACARSNMWTEVEDLFNQMENYSLPIQESILSSVINVCRKGSNNTFSNNNREDRLQSQSMSLWERSVWLLEKWGPKIANLSESIFTLAMDVLESHGRFDRIIYVTELMELNNVRPSRNSFSFAMRGAINQNNADIALAILQQAKQHDLDTPSMYNATVMLCDINGRHNDSIRVLLSMFYQYNKNNNNNSVYKIRIPAVWITRKVISNALDALTRNFSALFTEVVDGRLAPSVGIKPFIDDLTEVLRLTVNERNLYLSANSYPMANKLLLDAGDYNTVRALLNHTLYMSEVNSTRLYDFAVRSLVRVSPLSEGLTFVLSLIEDLYLSEYYKLAVNIFNQGLQRLSTLPITTATMDKRILGNESNDISDLKFRNSSFHKEMANQSRENCLLLHNYFLIARNILTTEFFPKKAYKIAAHVYKNCGMHDLMLELYKYAIYDETADKQFKNLVVYNLARSPDYWDAALDILNNLNEKPDLFMYTSGILACETGSDWEQAIYLLDKLQSDGYNLSTISVTSAISACASKGRATEALHLLDMMVTKNISPNVWTYNSVLSACAKVGRWRDALVIFQMMRGESSYFNIPFDNNIKHQNNKDEYDSEFDQTNSDEYLTSYKYNNEVEEEEDDDDDDDDDDDESDEVEDFFSPFEVSSNKFTYNTIIEVLGEGGQTHLIDEIYRNAISQGIFNPFYNIRMGYIDLHSHSSHMAKAALRFIFELFQNIINNNNNIENVEEQSVGNKRDKIIIEDTKYFLKLLNETSHVSHYNSNNNSNKSSDLTIIIGKGITLKNVVDNVLVKDLYPPLKPFVSKRNIGRLVITKKLLLEWVNYQNSFI